MRFRLFAIVAALSAGLMAPAGGALAETDGIEGRWLTGKRKVAVTLYRCGDAICGQIDWLAKPRYRGGELKIDRYNSDPALRERPWCGIVAVTGLREEAPGEWTDGTFYYPKDGNSYDLDIERRGDGLRVYAFLGIRLFGKTEDWVRAPDDLPVCEEAS